MNTLYIILAVIILLVLINKFMSRNIKSISTTELKTILAGDLKPYAFFDVRTPGEFKANKIKGFKNIPLNTMASKLTQFPKDKTIVLICQSGNRSSSAARQLLKAGYTDIINVSGGMNFWK